jgi:beta-galactosidase
VFVKVKSFTNFSRSSDLITNKLEYRFAADGSVKINHEMTPLGSYTVSWLPCLGIALKIPNEYQKVLWYGRGPYENYIDRNTGAKIGIHKIKIDSVQMPYIEPQEYGNYSDVRWLEIKNENGWGVKIIGDKALNFSAVPYYNLDRAKYNYQLFKDDFSRIQLNYGITGVGDTPNPPMPKYRVYPQVYSNSISIIPLTQTK